MARAVAREGCDAARAFGGEWHEEFAIAGRPDRRLLTAHAADVTDHLIGNGTVELRRQRTNRSAAHRHDEQFGIEPAADVVAVFVTDEGDLARVVRERGQLHLARRGRHPPQFAAVATDDEDIPQERIRRQIDGCVESELRAVRRPGRVQRIEVTEGQAARFGVDSKRADEEMLAPAVQQTFVVALERQRANVTGPRTFVDRDARGLRIERRHGGIGQRCSIGRPCRPEDRVVERRHRLGFAAV